MRFHIMLYCFRKYFRRELHRLVIVTDFKLPRNSRLCWRPSAGNKKHCNRTSHYVSPYERITLTVIREALQRIYLLSY